MLRCLYVLNGYINSTSSFQSLVTHINFWSDFPRYCYNSEVKLKTNKPLTLSIAKMNNFSEEEKKEIKAVKLEPIEATPENFKEYGQVILPIPDSQGFGPQDAQLDLSRGTPRFYIMRLQDRQLKFSTITHHANVTQCLGSIGSHVWYLGVAKPSVVNPSANIGASSKKISRSHWGHLYMPPSVEEVRVFRITGPKFLKLNVGTWHAGPLFLPEAMDFYNLELSDTNDVDHTNHNFRKEDGVCFQFDP